MKLNKLARNLALVGLCSQFAVAAFAQTTDSNGAPAEKIERVEVTGSSIKRVKDEAALPLQVITATQMRNMGITSTEQLVNQLSVNTANVSNAVSSNTVFTPEGDKLGGGGTYANLRGLGTTGTLVLLDGRRMSNQGQSGGAVDLNAIPFEMIERVEILKDGASAIYGTDAIGGVINFILKKNYQGFSITTTASNPLHSGGGARDHIGVSGGFGDLDKQRFNVMGALSYDKIGILRGSSRSWATGYQPDKYLVADTTSSPLFGNILATNPALVSGGVNYAAQPTLVPTAGVSVNGSATKYTTLNALALQNECDAAPFGVSQTQNPTIIPGLGYTASNSTYRCGTDYARQYMLQTPTKNLNAVLRGTFALGSDATGFLEFVGSRVNTKSELTPFQVQNYGTTAGNAAALYPVTGQYYMPTVQLLESLGVTGLQVGNPIAYKLRMSDWGDRILENVSTNKLMTAGVNGSFGDYDYKASISRGLASGYTNLLNGYVDANKMLALLGSGIYNPFLLPGQTQSAEAQQAIDATQVHARLQGGGTSITTASGAISGKLMDLPAGEMDFAVGVDLRREFYNFGGSGIASGFTCVNDFRPANLNNPALPNPIMGCSTTQNAPDSSRRVSAFYGELHVPVFKSLEFQLALRHDEYSGVGGTTNPKIAFKYTPTKNLLFRGSYNTGFRAPSAQQLYLGTQETSIVVADPLKCPNPVGNNDPSCSMSIPFRNGGNIDLKPERSKQGTLGVVFSPFDSLELSADYWQINMRDRIHNLTSAQEIQNYALFQDNFKRDDPSSPGTLTRLIGGWVNAGASITKGIDFTLTHSTTLFGGKLTTIGSATRMLSDKEALLAGQPMIEYLDQWTTDTLFQRWKTNISSTFAINSWATTLSVNYSSGYNDEDRTTYVSTNPANTPVHRRVASYTTFNLVTTYTGFKNVTLTGGLINVLDRQPPFTWHDPDYVIGAGYDPRVADPRGRTLQVSAKYSF